MEPKLYKVTEMEIAEQLQRIMGATGMSQTELAQRLSVSFATINSWVNGRSQPRRRAFEAVTGLFAEVVGGSPLAPDELRGLIERAESQRIQPRLLAGDKELLDRFSLAFTYNTNTIEGSTMTVADTEAVLFQGRTVAGRTLIEQLEAKNHQATLWWLLDQVSRPQFEVSPDLICDLHVRLMNGIMSDAGRYRHHAVRIVSSRTTVVNHVKIARSVEQLCDAAASDDDSLVHQLAKQHAEFERIHPFSDGNGRIGRLLMTAIALKHRNVPPIVLRERRAVYYKALELAQVNQNFDLLRQFLAESIMSSRAEVFTT